MGLLSASVSPTKFFFTALIRSMRFAMESNPGRGLISHAGVA